MITPNLSLMRNTCQSTCDFPSRRGWCVTSSFQFAWFQPFAWCTAIVFTKILNKAVIKETSALLLAFKRTFLFLTVINRSTTSSTMATFTKTSSTTQSHRQAGIFLIRSAKTILVRTKTFQWLARTQEDSYISILALIPVNNTGIA